MTTIPVGCPSPTRPTRVTSASKPVESSWWSTQGGPPPPAFAGTAHAGTLAFEFSVGTQRVVLNCGAAPPSQPAALAASRATAAHSTLVLADASSGRFVAGGRLGGMLYAGPRSVTVSRNDLPDHLLLDLSHDGYARRFGYVHHRRLALAIAGHHLAGEDRLVPVNAGRKKRQRLPFAIRFHLHHALRAAATADGTAVRIAFPSGESWLFEAHGMPVSIEESIFFANAEGPRRIDQTRHPRPRPGGLLGLVVVLQGDPGRVGDLTGRVPSATRRGADPLNSAPGTAIAGRSRRANRARTFASRDI